jgi:hypothetical protein
MMADATAIRIDKSAYDILLMPVVKNYPGFIAPNSTLG